MSEKIKDKIFNCLIWSFLILYLLVASISFFHCIEFCMVGNPLVLSIMMSFAFEVGLALTLFSVLITDENKNNIVSWILMTVLTCVQVMGNVFSVEKYMELSNNNFYIYIQHGFLHWFTDDMPQSDIMSIIAIILGALLPLVALLMTSMVARNWKNRMNEKKIDEVKETKEISDKQESPAFTENRVFGSTEQVKKSEQKEVSLSNLLDNEDSSKEETCSTIDEQKVENEQPQDEKIDEEVEEETATPVDVPETPSEEIKKSQLDNLIDKAKELAQKENQEKEIKDGSLLTPEESQEAKRAVAMASQRQPTISLFRPN